MLNYSIIPALKSQIANARSKQISIYFPKYNDTIGIEWNHSKSKIKSSEITEFHSLHAKIWRSFQHAYRSSAATVISEELLSFLGHLAEAMEMVDKRFTAP